MYVCEVEVFATGIIDYIILIELSDAMSSVFTVDADVVSNNRFILISTLKLSV